MVPYIVTDKCLKCGYCIERCPVGAIIAEAQIQWEGLTLQPVHIDPGKCSDCGVCVSEEWWCPAQAIIAS